MRPRCLPPCVCVCVSRHLQHDCGLCTATCTSATRTACCTAAARTACRYEQALRANNALDFDDLLGLAVALLRRSDDVRQRYQRRFRCGPGGVQTIRRWRWTCLLPRGMASTQPTEALTASRLREASCLSALRLPLPTPTPPACPRHVLVDEFQDTNSSQYELVKLLSQPRVRLGGCGGQWRQQRRVRQIVGGPFGAPRLVLPAAPGGSAGPAALPAPARHPPPEGQPTHPPTHHHHHHPPACPPARSATCLWWVTRINPSTAGGGRTWAT